MAVVEGLMVWLLMTAGVCMNLYEHTEYKVYEPEPIDHIKGYMAGLNTSIDRSERVEGWTCYDYSVDFAKNNPDFEVVTVSRSPEFEGISHMTNYQFYDDETMIVYDGLLDKLYFIHDLQWDVEDYDYYYFWIDETPTRECVDMVDNRMWLYE